MKPLILLSVISLPLFLTGCETTVVEQRYPRRTAYVERDVVVDHHPRRHGYVERDVVVTRPYRKPTTNVVVVQPRPAYQPRVEVRYYNDARGRYYFKNGRRVYVSSGVHY